MITNFNILQSIKLLGLKILTYIPYEQLQKEVWAFPKVLLDLKGIFGMGNKNEKYSQNKNMESEGFYYIGYLLSNHKFVDYYFDLLEFDLY